MRFSTIRIPEAADGMKRILIGMFINAVLIPAFWLCGPSKIPLIAVLACGNMLFYLALTGRFLYDYKKNPERHGFLLEFVLLQIFLCTGIFLFKLTDLILLHNSL